MGGTSATGKAVADKYGFNRSPSARQGTADHPDVRRGVPLRPDWRRGLAAAPSFRQQSRQRQAIALRRTPASCHGVPKLGEAGGMSHAAIERGGGGGLRRSLRYTPAHTRVRVWVRPCGIANCVEPLILWGLWHILNGNRVAVLLYRNFVAVLPSENSILCECLP